MFLAGILIPIRQWNGLLGILSHLMPLTYLADLARNVIYAGNPAYSEIVLFSPAFDLAVTTGIAAVFIIVGTALFTRSERTS